jgi:hypothetical protein
VHPESGVRRVWQLRRAGETGEEVMRSLVHIVGGAVFDAIQGEVMQDGVVYIGSLQPGVVADVSVLHDECGRWMLRDNEVPSAVG